MKNLSLEEKAKRYDEAIEKAEKWHNAPNVDKIPTFGNRIIEDIFPELKESEDEKVIRDIKVVLECSATKFFKEEGKMPIWYDRALAWLKKQGKVKENEDTFIQWDEDERIREDLIEWFEEFADLNWLSWRGHNKRDILAWLTKQSKQKPRGESAPEAIKELKYKDGDWIVYDNNVYKIVNIPHDNYYECLGIDNTIRVYNSSIDDKSHLWTRQDAKEGDMLCTYECDEPKIVFILKGTVKKHYALRYYCYYNIMYSYFEPDSETGCLAPYEEDIKPATKEQRDTLFAKIKESGYEWDADKKEIINTL